MTSLAVGHILGRAVIPALAGFLGFTAFLLVGRRIGPPDASPRQARSRGGYVRLLLGTAVGGYAVFLAFVAIFHVAVAGAPLRELAHAAVGGGVLAFGVAVPAFVLLGWLTSPQGRVRKG